jgi:hypothetical protein
MTYAKCSELMVADPLPKHQPTPNPDQASAIAKIVEWWQTSNDGYYRLTGKAGVGKTWTLARAIEAIYALPSLRIPRVAMMAPTHKAKGVMLAFVRDLGLEIDCFTCHALLHLKPGRYNEDGVQLIEVNTRATGPHISDYDLVICDESSAIGPRIFGFILAARAKVLFVGDHCQLDPVEAEDVGLNGQSFQHSPIFELPSLWADKSRWNEPNYPYHSRLTIIERYSGAVAIAADKIAAAIEGNRIGPRIESGGNLKVLDRPSGAALFVEYLRQNRGSWKDIKYLAYTNAVVERVNKQCREALFPGRDTYAGGDVLIAKETIATSLTEREWQAFVERNMPGTNPRFIAKPLETAVFGTDEDLAVLAATWLEVELVSGYTTMAIDLAGWEESTQNIPVVAPWVSERIAGVQFQGRVPAYWLTLLSAQTKLCASVWALNLDDPNTQPFLQFIRAIPNAIATAKQCDAGNAHLSQYKARCWGLYYGLLSKFNLKVSGKKVTNRLRYGFAQTTHEAQGSTYEVVFADFADMKKARNPNSVQRLQYTALTRCSDHAVVLQ